MNRLLVILLLVYLSVTCRGRLRGAQGTQPAIQTRADSDARTKAPDSNGASELGGDRRRVVDLLERTERALGSGETAAALAAAVSGRLDGADSPGWWKLTLPLSDVTVMLGTDNTDRLNEAGFTLQVSLSMPLRDLATFGPYKTIHESKTSSVRFVPAPPRKTTVYASLLSSRAAPDALVVSVTMRNTTQGAPTTPR